MSHPTHFFALALISLTALAGCPSGGGPGGLPNGFDTTPPSGVPTDATCSTDAWWTLGNEESELMHPGVDCISCHASEGEGPQYDAAGTVMSDFADFDDCLGVGGVTVRIIDADGTAHETTSNEAGNFYFEQLNIPTPYTVELESGGKTSAMVTPQTDLNCMTCHTDVGAGGAPGRIIAPQ